MAISHFFEMMRRSDPGAEVVVLRCEACELSCVVTNHLGVSAADFEREVRRAKRDGCDCKRAAQGKPPAKARPASEMVPQ